MIKDLDYTGIAIVPFVHDGQGNYLFGLRTEKCRDEHNCWELAGGGGLKFGESNESGIRRELKEELGTEPVKIEFIGHREVLREHNGQKTHWVVFDYLVQVNPEEVAIMEPDMCSEFRWSKIDAAPQPTYSQYPFVLEKYRDIL